MTRLRLSTRPARVLEARTLVVFGLNVFVVADDLADHEAQELLGEIGVEAGGSRQGTQALDLAGLAVRVGGRQVQAGLDVPDALGAAEPLTPRSAEASSRCAIVPPLGSQLTSV